MLVSQHVDGPWERVSNGAWPYGCNNPAAWIFPNGTTLLVCKRGWPETFRMQVAVAPHWRGPYRVARLTEVYGEDAFIWQAKEDGHFHMLTHSMYPKPDKIPTTAWSEDGLEWTPAFVCNHSAARGHTYPSFGHEIEMTDGSKFRLARRERHQLVLEDGVATHLLNGVTEAGRTDDFAFTSVQPINQA